MKIQKIILTILYTLFIATTLPFLLGFLNSLHPLFDSFSNFRVHLLTILIPLTIIIGFFHKDKYTYFYLLLTLLGTIYLYIINQPFLPTKGIEESNQTRFTQMQFNLNFRNQKIENFKEYITKNPIDIITLQEVTKTHQEALEKLKVEHYAIELKLSYPFIGQKKGAYPYQVYCSFRGVGGGAILSKYPINREKTVCIEGQGFLSTEVMVKNRAISIGTLHLHWPFPYQQQEQIEMLKPILKKIEKPTLISGDFNAVSWSDATSKVAQYSNTKVVDGLRWSIELKKQLPLFPFMKLSIDQLLLSNELKVKDIKIKENLGSDHLPIVAEIQFLKPH